MSERMLFCLGEEKPALWGEGYQKNYRIFNKPVSKAVFKKAVRSRPDFDLPLAESWDEAWKKAWPNASKEFRTWVKELPNFNPVLFKKITGIAI